MAKHDKTGRNKNAGEKFARLFLATMQTPAWQALTPYAQRLYPWLQMEWHGPRANNNGQIRFSVRQAGDVLGCNRETARKALADLQRKGFLAVRRCATLGAEGDARGHEYELTELGTPENPVPRKLFRNWTPGADFPVVMARANNPRGIGGAQNLKSQLTKSPQEARPQLTGRPGPNLRCKSNEAKNRDSPTYGVSHPYLPGGTGRGHVSQPINPAASIVGEAQRFAAVLPGGAVRRVGVRSMIHCNSGAAVRAEGSA